MSVFALNFCQPAFFLLQCSLPIRIPWRLHSTRNAASFSIPIFFAGRKSNANTLNKNNDNNTNNNKFMFSDKSKSPTTAATSSTGKRTVNGDHDPLVEAVEDLRQR